MRKINNICKLGTMTLFLICVNQLTAQGKFMKKLAAALEPQPMEGGWYEMGKTANGGWGHSGVLPQQWNLKFKNSGDTTVEYKGRLSPNGSEIYCDKLRFTGSQYKIYYYHYYTTLLIQFEDSILYFIKADKSEWENYKFTDDKFRSIVIANKELKNAMIKKDEKNEKYIKLMDYLKQTESIVQNISKAKAKAEEQANKEGIKKLIDADLPWAGQMNGRPFFKDAKAGMMKAAPDYLLNKGWERFVPVYGYDRYNNPEYGYQKNSIGNITARQTQFMLVCSNKEAGKLDPNNPDLVKYHFNNKYVCMLVTVQQNGDGTNWQGDWYITNMSWPSMIGDKVDAMKYKK